MLLFSQELELTALIKNITSSARKLLDCQRGSLFLVSDDRKSLFTKVAEGLDDRGKIKEIRLPIGMGIVGACVTNNMVINIPDAYADDRFDRAFDQKSGFRTKSILAVPICSADGTVVGVAQMLNKNGREGVFDVGDENLLRAFGSQVRKRHFQKPFLYNCDLFTKTGLDKHRESTQKTDRFLRRRSAWRTQGCSSRR
jgi:signal transduction protein with GAF and PtsI domain